MRGSGTEIDAIVAGSSEVASKIRRSRRELHIADAKTAILISVSRFLQRGTRAH